MSYVSLRQQTKECMSMSMIQFLKKQNRFLDSRLEWVQFENQASTVGSIEEESRELAYSLCHVNLQQEGCHHCTWGRRASLSTWLCWRLDLELLASRIMQNCFLFKASCLWFSVTTTLTNTWYPFPPWNIIRKQTRENKKIKYAFPIHFPSNIFTQKLLLFIFLAHIYTCIKISQRDTTCTWAWLEFNVWIYPSCWVFLQLETHCSCARTMQQN